MNETATAEQMEEFHLLLALPENEAIAQHLLNRAFKEEKEKKDISEEAEATILRSIFSQRELLAPEKRPLFKKIWLRRTAAAVFWGLILWGGIWIYLNQQRTATRPPEMAKAVDIPPGKDQATLTLSDGRIIEVSAATSGTLAQQGNLVVKKGKDGQVVYQVSKAGKDNTNLTNTLTTPAGGETSLMLSDGTQVTLDASSSLTYPVAFAGEERKVTVSGQAYFKVKHNELRPFVVIAGDQTIRDIGTEFNVNTYNDTKTTLVEGVVSVNGNTLSPGQQAISTSKGIDVKKVEIEEAVSWTTGYFRFNNENIHTIMDKISRWYNIEVIYEPGVTAEGITGTISRYKNISQVFYMLSYGQHLHFKIDGRRVTVMP